MKNELIFIVQECICIDFLINAIITTNIYNDLKIFNNLKKENLKNMKIICHIYKHAYKNELLIKDTPSIILDKKNENNLSAILKYSLNILTRINSLKKQYPNSSYNTLFQVLYNRYFDLISYVHCFYPLSSDTSFNLKNTLNLESSNRSFTFFNLLNSNNLNSSNNKINDFEAVRNICIEAIYIFFDYYLSEDIITEESYEVFFENTPENKFYQFFFKSNNISFKVRIYDKSLIVFYIYQFNENTLAFSPPLSKLDSSLSVDMYLKEKFKEKYDTLFFDENYINSSYYKNNLEYYKFKYNYDNKSLYISINVNSNTIQELYLI